INPLLSPSPSPPNPTCPCPSPSATTLPHLHGHLRYGDNLDDEWFLVFLLFHTSLRFPNLSIRLWDSDGEFLLIEAAFHLPRWLNPETALNRLFLRNGNLHIVPKTRIPNPSLIDSLKFLINSPNESLASEPIQLAVKNRISGYPEKAMKNMHTVRVRVPVSVAQVLKHEPCLISLAVEGFYDRDVDSMKFAARMERMSRAMYAQLVRQTFRAPKVYPAAPPPGEREAFFEAELGMKIAWRGRTWEAFRKSLEEIGYFQGLLPGSSEYQRLLKSAEEYYMNTSLHSRESELMSAPVRRIDEGHDVPPSDDDSWLDNGEEELDSALLERQKEMELYESKHKKKGKGKENPDVGPSSGSKTDEFDPSNIAKSMQAFVNTLSSYKGAEAPDDRNREVDLDVDQFIKDMESIMRCPGGETANSNVEEGSSSDLDFDDSDESDMDESGEDNKDDMDAFMHSYSDVMNEQLKSTTLHRSFVRAKEQIPKKDEGTSAATEDMDEDFSPVDVDVNLVKSFLDSFSSQQGLPGPASNLLGLMGVQFPQDANKKGK
ncbi:hypothetical protein AAHE18_15G001700, partial [Arachis hypogaea]